MQDEPPFWAGADDSDGGGMESVSEPDPDGSSSFEADAADNNHDNDDAVEELSPVPGGVDDETTSQFTTRMTTRQQYRPELSPTTNGGTQTQTGKEPEIGAVAYENPAADTPKNAIPPFVALDSSGGQEGRHTRPTASSPSDESEDADERVGPLNPQRPSILLAGGRSRLDSWVQPEPEGEAPNGAPAA